jgi:spore coat protein JB
MTKSELMRKIQQLAFVKHEAQLFLDTHPNSTVALEFFNKSKEALELAVTEYQNKYGAIVSDGGANGKWTWIDGKWPWQADFEDDDDGKEWKK